jgi:lysophospholipase L1-like esterase
MHFPDYKNSIVNATSSIIKSLGGSSRYSSLKELDNYNEYHDVFEKIADKNNINYLDYNLVKFNGEKLDNRYFKDDNHLNTKVQNL